MAIILKKSVLDSDISSVATTISNSKTALESAQSSKQSTLLGELATQTTADIAELNTLRVALNTSNTNLDTQSDARKGHIDQLESDFATAAAAAVSELEGMIDGSDSVNFAFADSSVASVILHNSSQGTAAKLMVVSGSDGIELKFDDDSSAILSSGAATTVGGLAYNAADLGITTSAVYTATDLGEFSE